MGARMDLVAGDAQAILLVDRARRPRRLRRRGALRCASLAGRRARPDVARPVRRGRPDGDRLRRADRPARCASRARRARRSDERPDHRADRPRLDHRGRPRPRRRPRCHRRPLDRPRRGGARRAAARGEAVDPGPRRPGRPVLPRAPTGRRTSCSPGRCARPRGGRLARVAHRRTGPSPSGGTTPEGRIMAKHSKAERERRTAQSARVAEIEAAWMGSVPDGDRQGVHARRRGRPSPRPRTPPTRTWRPARFRTRLVPATSRAGQGRPASPRPPRLTRSAAGAAITRTRATAQAGPPGASISSTSTPWQARGWMKATGPPPPGAARCR